MQLGISLSPCNVPVVHKKDTIQQAIALLRSVGGRMYIPGPTSRILTDGTGAAAVAGDVIGYMPDRVTGLTANAATQATTAAKPKLIREILGYSERYSLEFDGVDDRLFSSSPGISLDAGVMLCAAITTLSLAPGSPVFSARNATGGEGLQFGTDANGIYAYVSDGATTQYPASKVCQPGETIVFTVWRDANTWKTRANGVALGSLANKTASIPAFTGLAIGGDARTAYAKCNARVGAGALAMGITTLDQVQTIERAVAQAAGIAL